MNGQENQGTTNSEILKPVLEALQVPVRIANQSVDSIFWLAMMNIGSGALIAIMAYQSLGRNAVACIFLFMLISAPSFTLSKLHTTLKEIILLPEKISQFAMDSLQKAFTLYKAHNELKKQLKDADWRVDSLIKQRRWRASDLAAATRTAQSGFSAWKRLQNLLTLARRLRAAKSVLREFEGLATLSAGAMLLANPLFLTLVIASVLATFLWTMVAILALIIHIV
jgi:uncharacterized membrane protein